MPPYGARPGGGAEREAEPDGQIVLIQSEGAPKIPAGPSTDIRPGGVVTFDGDRIRYPLTVIDTHHVAHIDWMSLGALERAVRIALRDGAEATIRFGDRAICRAALGRERLDRVEQRLGSVARREQAMLMTWTRSAPRDADYRMYDVVVGRPPGQRD